jgi:hypothetical protein
MIAVTVGLVALTLGRLAQAIVPAPDGGYPGGNTAEGRNALFGLTTGTYNTAVGLFSLTSNMTGGLNTGLGAGTLLANTAGENTAVGTAALLSNTTASGNTAVGGFALFSNTTGGTVGNVQGYDIGPNVAVGAEALESNTVAGANTAMGYRALQRFTTGPVDFEQLGLCTAVGFQALGNATGGAGNSGFGYQTLFNNTGGSGNAAIGAQALFNNTIGDGNIAIGVSSLFNNSIGRWNVAIGGSTLINNVTGESNTAVGQQAMQSNVSGSNNTALGFEALIDNTNGSHNIAVGDGAGVNVMTADRVICIGAVGEDTSNTCYIGQIFNTVSAGGSAVLIDANNKLGTITSSRRFKDEIKPMEQASEALFALKPVTFRYKKQIDPSRLSQFGLVAEEVERVNPDLVVHDKEGKPYSVRYDAINAMLLNEFLKEHQKVRQLEHAVAQQRDRFEATVAELKKEIADVVAHSKNHGEQIEKVRARVELKNAEARRVAKKQ